MHPGEKRCPGCGTSYRPEALRCADCDVELVDQATFEAMQSEPAPAVDFENLECVRATDPDWAEGLHVALGEAGISSNIAAVDDGSGRGIRVGVFVATEDRERAIVLDHEFARTHLGVEGEQLQAGRCGICNAVLDDATEELCEACRGDLEPETPGGKLVLGSDGIPRQGGPDGGGAARNAVLLIGGLLLGLGAIFWLRSGG